MTVLVEMMLAWTFLGGLAGACSPVLASTRMDGGPWPMLLKAETLTSYSVLGYRPPMLYLVVVMLSTVSYLLSGALARYWMT